MNMTSFFSTADHDHFMSSSKFIKF